MQVESSSTPTLCVSMCGVTMQRQLEKYYENSMLRDKGGPGQGGGSAPVRGRGLSGAERVAAAM